MYSNDGQVLGAATTTGGAVAALPLTAGNSVFQTLLIATAVIAAIALVIRIAKIASSRKTL